MPRRTAGITWCVATVLLWTIDISPIDFRNIPNNDPDRLVEYKEELVSHPAIAVSQVTGFREFLDANGYADTPIWITDVAIQVGFNAWIFDTSRPGNPITPSPFATFYWGFMTTSTRS